MIDAGLGESSDSWTDVATMLTDLSVCVFDRAGYPFHGRVKAVADGAREHVGPVRM